MDSASYPRHDSCRRFREGALHRAIRITIGEWAVRLVAVKARVSPARLHVEIGLSRRRRRGGNHSLWRRASEELGGDAGERVVVTSLRASPSGGAYAGVTSIVLPPVRRVRSNARELLKSATFTAPSAWTSTHSMA